METRDDALMAALRVLFGDRLDAAMAAYDEVIRSGGSDASSLDALPVRDGGGAAAGFRLFENMGYREGRPDLLKRYGIEHIGIWYGGSMWPGGTPGHGDFSLPSRVTIEGLAKRQSSGHCVLDIEHWPVDGGESEMSSSMENYLTVLDWYKSASGSDKSVGYYGVVPIRDYWSVLRGRDGAWKKKNDRLRPLADAVDALYPSVYTFYDDREGWVRYAEAQIAEARRVGGSSKPVYAFLWPEYHPSNKDMKGRPIEPEYWRLQLETMRGVADGVVIWTLNRAKDVAFREIPPWWQSTVEFIFDEG